MLDFYPPFYIRINRYRGSIGETYEMMGKRLGVPAVNIARLGDAPQPDEPPDFAGIRRVIEAEMAEAPDHSEWGHTVPITDEVAKVVAEGIEFHPSESVILLLPALQHPHPVIRTAALKRAARIIEGGKVPPKWVRVVFQIANLDYDWRISSLARHLANQLREFAVVTETEEV